MTALDHAVAHGGRILPDEVSDAACGGWIFRRPVVITSAGPLPGHDAREDLSGHIARFGALPDTVGASGVDLHERIREWGLTGRGGGHFPVAAKWDAAVSDLQQRPVVPRGTPRVCRGAVVVNAAEGEPASAKDAALLLLRPHLVLDGAVALATYLGLGEVVVWVHAIPTVARRRPRRGAPTDATPGLVRASLDRAIAERVADPNAALSSAPQIRVMQAPIAYTSGESTAVIRAVQPTLLGAAPGVAAPMFVTDVARPWGDGPVVIVHNAETLARVALLARGVSDRTSLVTVAVATGGGLRRAVVEVPSTHTLLDVLRSAGAEPGPVLLGGYGGTWVDPRRVDELVVDPALLRAEGLSLGAGVVFVAPPDRPLMNVVAELTSYLAGQSAQQCGPCMFGLPALSEAVAKQAKGRGNEAGVRRLLDLVDGRGGCRHPDGVARMVRSAMDLVGR
jgi:NADH:ubiquinone oxidoreductase subunit F (NADH-binding)